MGEAIEANKKIMQATSDLASDIPKISPVEHENWRAHNFYSQMMDVCGEIENAKRLQEIYETDRDAENFEKLKSSLDKIHKYCSIVRLDPKTTDAQRTDLTIAEWFLRDSLIGENTFNISPDSSSDWFDQWLFDINFDLLD